jgi:hypothetical protein
LLNYTKLPETRESKDYKYNRKRILRKRKLNENKDEKKKRKEVNFKEMDKTLVEKLKIKYNKHINL